MHKHNQTDIMKFGPTGGVGTFHSLDVYVSSEVIKIPSKYHFALTLEEPSKIAANDAFIYLFILLLYFEENTI